MRSTGKIHVDVDQVAGKPWAVVYSMDGTKILIPSFEDLHRMIVAIVHCEREKYRGQIGHPASRLVRDFLMRSVQAADWLCTANADAWPHTEQSTERAWAALANQFKLEHRG